MSNKAENKSHVTIDKKGNAHVYIKNAGCYYETTKPLERFIYKRYRLKRKKNDTEIKN